MVDDLSLPTGTVTLVLGDVENSTSGWDEDPASMLDEIRSLYATVDELAQTHGGTRPEEQGEGDSFVVAFGRARNAVVFTVALQRSLRESANHQLRIGIHTGDVELRDASNYAGPTVNRCARLRSLGHGGQTLMSQVTADIVADDLPDGVTTADLGTHQLRDLARPEHVHQLVHPDLQNEYPPLRGSGSRSPNLPTHIGPLIGRVRELADVAALVEDHRLVTVTGAGGCGKTRLVLELAAEMVDAFADGVWWVDLAPVADPARVTTATVTSLQIQQSSGTDEIGGLTTALGDASMLIVLDNCEHVVGEAARVVRALMQRCANVRVAVTSREPLAIAHEAVYRVPSMSVPGLEWVPSEVGRSDSVALFVERAKTVAPGFALAGQEEAVAAICRRLDGIPLAIELAAARVRMMAPRQIADALADRFRLLTGGDRTALPRQRTLEGSVEWSYDLLPLDARTVLARLSVFAGSFALDSAEEVCAGAGVQRRHVLDLLSTLVDRSLVQIEPSPYGSPRYRLLETLRVYARERLIQSRETAATRGRHLAHFCDLSKRATADVRSPDRMAQAIRLGTETDNLRAAMDWAATSDRADDVLAIASSGLWIAAGLFEETRERITACLPDCTQERLRVRALTHLSSCSMLLGDYRRSLEQAHEAVETGRRSGSRKGLALALGWLGWAEAWMGVPSVTARPHLIEAEERAIELDLPSATVNAIYMRGQLEAFQEDMADGIARIQKALNLAVDEAVPEAMFCYVFMAAHQLFAGRIDDAWQSSSLARDFGASLSIPAFTALATNQMGLISAYRGRLDDAQAELAAGVELARRHGLKLFEGLGTSWTGIGHYIAGDDEQALAVLRPVSTLFEDFGSHYNTLLALSFLAMAEIRTGDLDAARQTVERSRRLAAEHCFPGLEARCEVAASRLALADDDPADAAESSHRAIEMSAGIGARTVVIEGLESLAAVESASDPDLAVRLIGAVDSGRTTLGWPRFISETNAWDDLAAGLQEQVGDEFASLLADGQGLSIDDAIALARRGRGRQRRATTGWASLTPTEMRVVDQVALGLTNKEVAASLFVSVNTVKTHLSHVFDKLGVTTRSELTAAAAQRPEGRSR
mgnify:CR=1 FL=1